MGLETGTYISDLVVTNPVASDAKSQGDDHLRLLKATIKTTFPNISGAVTPTHTELNYVDGVTSAIQTQIDAKGAITGQAWTGSHTFPTQTAADNSTKAATTAYVDTADALKANLASPTLTGTPLAPTASAGTNTTQIATTAFATQLAFQAALPVQTGATGKFLQTDGSNASWTNITNSKNAQAGNYTLLTTDRYKHLSLTGTFTLTLLAAATAGDGYIVYVRNDGTGVWTIDGNASETIDARTTIKVYQGEAFALICDGSNWRTFGRSRGPILIASSTVGSAVSSIDFETGFDDTEFRKFRLIGHDLSSDTNPSDPLLRVKKSGSYVAASYVSAGQDDAANAEVGYNSGGVPLINKQIGTTELVSFEAEVINPFATNDSHLIKINGSSDGGALWTAAANEPTAAAIQGLRIIMAGAQIDAGTAYLYGER